MARPTHRDNQREIEKRAQEIADERCKEREAAIAKERKQLTSDQESCRQKEEELSEREKKIEAAEKQIEERKNQAAEEARREIEENEESIRKDYLEEIKKNAENEAERTRSEAEEKAKQTVSEAEEKAKKTISEADAEAAGIRQKANEDAEEIRSSMIEDLDKREHDLETREEDARKALSKAGEAERQAKEAQRKYEIDTLQAMADERLKRDGEIDATKVALEEKIKEYAALKSELDAQRLDLEEEREYVHELKEKYKTGSPEKVERLSKEKEDLQAACATLEEQIGNLQQQVDSMSRRENGKSVGDLQRELEANKEYITELEKELEQCPADGDIARWKQDSADLAQLKEENRQLHEDKSKLESQLAAAAYTSRELDGARLEAQALRALNDQMKEKLRYFSDAYDTVKEDKFAGLIQIDNDVAIQSKDDYTALPADVSLQTIVEHIRNYAASRKKNPLFYDAETIRVFLASLAASHDSSRLLLLQGLSGTGKSSLPRIVAEALGFEWNQVSVQPSWRDNRELLGYDNDFTHRFKETEFTKILYRASVDQSKVNIVVLDEVNLARIEYYFADFLSELEKTSVTWKIPLISNYQPQQGEDTPKYLECHSGTASLIVGKNVWFIGTANNDDSTATITDKVYDRAQIIDMDHRADEFKVNTPVQALSISYETLQQLFEKAWNDKKLQLSDDAEQDIDYYIDIHLQSMDITFGNRIKMQLRRFVPVYMAAGGKRDDAIDYYLAHKILRRLDERYDIYIAEELDGLENEITTHYKGSSFKETKAKIKTLKRKNFSRGGDE